MSNTKEKYTLTDEHRAQLKPWADKWIANAMSTTPMSSDDKLDCVGFVKEINEEALGLAKRSEILDEHGVPTKRDDKAEKIHRLVPAAF